MFRTIGDGLPPWESLLPAEVLWLPEDLAPSDRNSPRAVYGVYGPDDVVVG